LHGHLLCGSSQAVRTKSVREPVEVDMRVDALILFDPPCTRW
jgi:hypothetical protein